ncbi:hypothetical protein PsorP6_018707 [Peronosclerospora sorghi]|nr:hypothetical protein PsorP6_018725 [Peronosclerospora sorghi]KAI9895407.1 hypothetical protein PsorP6_018707 [Peronosclerospora sorghi]
MTHDIAELATLELKTKTNKRQHSAVAPSAGEKNCVVRSTAGGLESLKKDEIVSESTCIEEDEREDEKPPRKLSRLANEILKKSAAVPSNQVIVNAFWDYGDQQLQRGHSGLGVSHLRAARAIRDYRIAITSIDEARKVPLIGSKMATQVEQVLNFGKLEDKAENSGMKKHPPSQLLRQVLDAPAKIPENQPLVDELVRFGRGELSRSRGTSHLRAARNIQLFDRVITSGAQAREEVALVGQVIADEIDQILRYGRVVKNSPHLAAKVKPRHDYSALQPENQHIFDEVVDRGDESFRSDQWKEGVMWVQAAKASPDTDAVVKSEEEAELLKRAVDKEEISEVNQMLQKERETADAVAGDTRKSVCSDAESCKDQCAGNQDSPSTQEKEESEQETVLTRAAHCLHDAAEKVTSGISLSSIGEKVATFINQSVVQPARDSASSDNEDVE